jgi:glycosyltransferase involved in cell wall biosynthesis
MANPKPKVSIGIPVYNGEKYLQQALESILSQSYTDFELIIADNASTDRTREICLTYARKDPRIRYHRNEENIGAAPNHNLLFHLAKGEYFKWAAYDDRIAPNFLAKCVEVMDKHPDVILCMPHASRIDEHGSYAGNHIFIHGADDPVRTKRFRNFALYNRSGNFMYGLMRASALSKTSLHGSFASSDLVFLAELALYGTFYVLPETLFHRRSHPAQSTKGPLSREWMRTLWFDTSLQDRLVLPKWFSLFALFRAIRRAPLRRMEHLRCVVYILHWVFLPRNFRGLVKDLIRAGIRIISGSQKKTGGKSARMPM